MQSFFKPLVYYLTVMNLNCSYWSSLVVQQVKDPALSLLGHRFDPWPENFHMPWAKSKKKDV